MKEQSHKNTKTLNLPAGRQVSQNSELQFGIFSDIPACRQAGCVFEI
ncbi:MAG: hypothetical protein HYY40_12605 [Bacteroidetes bacterium]|nr:hypothetical protein [Bacteroidota bacterium]